MAINARHTAYLTRLKDFATTMETAYGEAHALKESFDEEFNGEQDNSFEDENEELMAKFNFDSDDVKAAVDQAVTQFINYWTGIAVAQREYGKDLRRIK